MGKRRNFERCKHNETMRSYVLLRDRKRCFFCHKPIVDDEFELYPILHNHKCITDATIFQQTLSQKYREVPDCENCFLTETDAFERCSRCYVPAHRECCESHKKKRKNR